MPSVNNLSEFSNFLQAYRREKRLTQQELARLLDCNPSTISYYESGRGECSITSPFYRDVVALVGVGCTVPPVPKLAVKEAVSQPVVEIQRPDAAIAILQKLYSRMDTLEQKINSLLGLCQVE
jgi:transcriptional regulator with XRE-family HTH domain